MSKHVITPRAVRGRHLTDEQGRPYFWLADTAWELVHRLTREEIVRYADVRQRQGFGVTQFVLLAELDGLRTPNPQGHLPLDGNDPTRPNEGYFKDVDFAVRTLNDRGLVACLLPTWGDKWTDRNGGAGPVIFDEPIKARTYGRFLGERYRDAAVVWMLGGDRATDTDLHRRVIEAMSRGLREGDGGRHLQTFHPRGAGHSVEQLAGDPDWIDFHAVQSGHTQLYKGKAVMAEALAATGKPVIESEPRYEDHPRMSPDWSSAHGHFSPQEIRHALYRAVLAGSPGVTYGCHPVWQMYAASRDAVNRVRRPWQEALTLPGAEQVIHLRRFFEGLAWWDLVPTGEASAGTADGRLEVEYAWGEVPLRGERFDPAAGRWLEADEAPSDGDALVVRRR